MKLIREWNALCENGLCKDYLSEREKYDSKHNGTVYLTGKFSAADEENGNKRVYPYDTLKREIDLYQKLINENRALGECVDRKTQIMTKYGWKNISDVKFGDEVYTKDFKTGGIVLEKVKEKIERDHIGEMYHFTNKSNVLDKFVTPGHKFVLIDRKGKYYKKTAEEIYNLYKVKDSFLAHSYIPKSGGEWLGMEPKIQFSDKKISPRIWAAFLGFWLGDGTCPNNNSIVITQKKEHIKSELRVLFKEMPYRFKERTDKNGKTIFSFIDKKMAAYLRGIGTTAHKHIPEDVKLWPSELQEILLKWILKADGRNRKRQRKNVEYKKGPLFRELYTTSYQLAKDFEELFYKIGSSANIIIRQQKDRLIEGRLIEAKNSQPLYIVSETSAKGIYFSKYVNIEKVPFRNKVYCVRTKNGNWLMKRNGHACWTSNCDHPDSEIINLKNASHLVTSLWWENKVLMGKAKVLNTPSGKIIQSLINDGVQLGVSSRALGSLNESVSGPDIVQEDLILIAFDIVSEPSSVGAFLKPQTINESIVKKVFNQYSKSDRINRKLTEIVNKL